MPRRVETHLLQQRVRNPKRARLHLCGNALIVAEASQDTDWLRGLFLFDTADEARLDRDRRLTALNRTGYHLVTSQRFTVPAAVAMRCYTQLDVLDQPFEDAWSQTWTPALQVLAHARAADTGTVTHLVLLANFEHHAAKSPWGPALRSALADAPQAVHHDTGLMLVGVGDATRQWLQSYYASALEKTPPVLPAEPDDTSLAYTFALRVWQPELDGPIAKLAEALVTARDLAAAGVPL